MAKYINADELEKEGYELIRVVARHNDEDIGWTEVSYTKPTEYQPAADVVEVRHGRWIEEPGLIPHCSICGEYSQDAEIGALYCPYCGALLVDGEAEE